MGAFAAKYTADQREAVAIAYVDLGMRPARRVCEAAAADALRLNGEPVGTFTIPETSVLDLARKLRQRRAGQVSSELAKAPARDAAEALKRALANMTEQEIRAEQRKRIGKRDPEKIRQLARAAREIAQIPDRADPKPNRIGEKIPGTQDVAGGKTRGGLAGAILQAAGEPRVSTRTGPGDVTAQEATHNRTHDRDRAAAGQGEAHGTLEQQGEHEAMPGSWASDQVAALR